MKKLLALLFCGLCVLTLSGCQSYSLATIQSSSNLSMQVVAGKGFVSQRFAFPTYAKELVKQGKSQTQVDEYIEELEASVRNDVYNRMYLSYYSVYASRPNNNYLIGSSQVEFKTATYNPKTDKIEFSFNFNSYAAWNYYHPSSGEEGEDDDENLFLNISSSQGIFPFAQTAGETTVGEKYAGLIDSALQNHFSQSDIEKLEELSFSYDYVTYHKRLHSNADEIVENGGYYHHIWTASRSNLNSEKQIKLTSVSAVRGWWYLVVLASVVGAAGIGCSVIFVTNKIKAKKRNKKEA